MSSCSVPCLHCSISSSVWEGSNLLIGLISPYSMPKLTAKEASSQSCYIRAAAKPKMDHIAPGGNCLAARSTPQQRALRFNASLVQKIPKSLVSKECHGHQAAAEFEWELFLLIMPCHCTRKGKKKKEKYLLGQKGG